MNTLDMGAVTVAARSVRMFTGGTKLVILAGGSVELADGGEGITHTLIVSGGDVTLNCELANSLVIARGHLMHRHVSTWAGRPSRMAT